jgi:hypothetical protein
MECIRHKEMKVAMTMLRAIYSAAMVAAFWSAGASAVTVSSTIEALQVEPGSQGVYIKLAGYSAINETSCNTNPWGFGDMNNEDFMIYIYPALLTAHAKSRSVTIGFAGCNGQYARIGWVQVNAQ